MGLEEKLKAFLDSPAIDSIIESKLAELATQPQGMMLAMMGLNPVQLKPMIKPFVGNFIVNLSIYPPFVVQ